MRNELCDFCYIDASNLSPPPVAAMLLPTLRLVLYSRTKPTMTPERLSSFTFAPAVARRMLSDPVILYRVSTVTGKTGVLYL